MGITLKGLIIAAPALAGLALLFSLFDAPPDWPGRFLFLLAQILVVFLAAWGLARLSLQEPISRLTEWMRNARSGAAPRALDVGGPGPLAPLAEEAVSMARSLLRAEEAAGHEARLRAQADSLWTPDRLREHVRSKLRGNPLVMVSNREPYRHVRQGPAVECQMPASGLVTGVEPLLRACGGAWIAHGDGDADWENADASGRLGVPPERPQYVLRRLRLTPEEEKGYYDGFANEGLWPLCHNAYNRPVFRAEDWDFYRSVNTKFAEAVLDEIGGMSAPFVLIQDYHFTLLPRLIKERRPDARIALFWHIPWPNPEAFAICPWQNEMLEGILGADLFGFHTQYHCNNFIETVDRSLECRVDREHFSIGRGSHSTLVRTFPISVDFPEGSAPPVPEERLTLRRDVLRRHGAPSARFVAVGVDRLDYTKGLLERFKGVERFLEKYPAYRGRFVLLQAAAPSRTMIPRYQEFMSQIVAEAARINARFPSSGAGPIALLARHHGRAELLQLYRAADVCLVTPLHDGMNLVAKEFVASRDDEQGVLVLSRFTGAARELRDALIVNPYDTEALSESLRAALEMSAPERALRMFRLRRVVRENNVYRWAGLLISELAAIRLEPSPALPV